MVKGKGRRASILFRPSLGTFCDKDTVPGTVGVI